MRNHNIVTVFATIRSFFGINEMENLVEIVFGRGDTSRVFAFDNICNRLWDS